jgi:hypothetical protein
MHFPMIYEHSVTATFGTPTDMSHNTRRSASDWKSAGDVYSAMFDTGLP